MSKGGVRKNAGGSRPKYPWAKMNIGDYFDVKCNSDSMSRLRTWNSLSSNRVNAQKVLGFTFALASLSTQIRVVRVKERRSFARHGVPAESMKGKFLGVFYARRNANRKYVPKPEEVTTPIAPSVPRDTIMIRMASLIAQKKPQEAVAMYKRFTEKQCSTA